MFFFLIKNIYNVLRFFFFLENMVVRGVMLFISIEWLCDIKCSPKFVFMNIMNIKQLDEQFFFFETNDRKLDEHLNKSNIRILHFAKRTTQID